MNFASTLIMYSMIQSFLTCQSIGDLANLMVDTRKHHSYPLVYRLVKLALTLPVATATVERCFSAMKIVKNALHNKIGDKFLSYSLICFVEKDMLDTISNDVIMDRFRKVTVFTQKPNVRSFATYELKYIYHIA